MNPEIPKERFYFQWHFLERCNLRCIHCYQEYFNTKELDSATLLKIATIMEKTLEKWGRIGRVSLTGGEPFMRKDLLLELLSFFERSDHFYWTGILSNGTLIDREILEKIKVFSKLKEVQISLDGTTPESHDAIRGKGSFDKATTAISLLKQEGFTVSGMFTLHKENRDEALPMMELAQSLDMDYLTIERMVPMGELDQDRFLLSAGELEKIYRDIYFKKKEIEARGKLKIRVSRPLWGLIDPGIGGFCPAGFSSLSILHDGTVLPCRRLEIPLGNILEEGLFKIWYTSDVLWKLRNKKKYLDQKCRDCELLGNCGGCRAIAHAVNKDFNAADPQCWKEE